jgi:Zn-finger nucleic acid-binding protein
MECPVCKKIMSEQDFGGVKVDVCNTGCKGIWFDWFELKKLDEKNEGMGDLLKQSLNSEHHKDSNRGKIKCPKCQNPMTAHFYQSSKEVTVDECYQCGGFYLDSGELEVIRENFMNEQDREEYVKHLISRIPEVAIAKSELAADKMKVNPATVYRAQAVAKFVGMLGHTFKK